MAGFENDIGYAKNFDFTQADNQAPAEANGLSTNGQMWIGTTSVNAGGTHINVGSLTSPSGTLTIGYSSPNITLDLAGGSVGIDSVAVQTGTSPVVPTGAGLITFNGAVVAAGTNPVRTDGTGANTYALEVQISQALAATDATKIGLSNFDSDSFAVDANGFVTLTISPVLEIIGGPGITVTGTSTSPIINSVVYTDQGSSTSVISDSGSFATAAITLTLPASPSQGDLCEFVAATAAVLIVDAPGTQLIQIGNSVSSAGGTATSSGLKSDSLSLRYRTSDTTWYATSVIGVWVTA